MPPCSRSGQRARVVVLSCLLLTGACTGDIGILSGPGQGAPDQAGPPDSVAGECDEAATAFAPARLWQLTDEQYVNAVRDLFGVALEGPDARIVSAAVPDTYTNYSEGVTINQQIAPSYQLAAQKVAQRVVSRAGELLGSEAPDDGAVRTFLRSKVSRAFRRPLRDEEVDALAALYQSGLPDHQVALDLVMQAVLQAPSFLYRTELGAGEGEAGPVVLTPYETASALSFLTLESIPDDALWARAEDGTLAQPEVLAAEVDRMLALPQVRANLTRKASFWLNLESLPNKEKAPDIFPEFTPSLKQSLYRSVQAFLSDALWNGTLHDLFASSTVHVNRELGEVYGIAGADGDELVAVEVPGRSGGLLTQPGFLASANKWADRGDPIHRGLYVYEAFVCGGTVPPPPADAFDEGAKLTGTEREKVATRASMPRCAGCHALFDPIGLTFERYDGIGRYSETRYTELDPATGVTTWHESSTPIDDTGMLSSALGEQFAGEVSGLGELAERLSGAGDRVARCASRRLAEYSLGYNPESQRTCEFLRVQKDFEATGSFADFFRALLTSPAFITRSVPTET